MVAKLADERTGRAVTVAALQASGFRLWALGVRTRRPPALSSSSGAIARERLRWITHCTVGAADRIWLPLMPGWRNWQTQCAAVVRNAPAPVGFRLWALGFGTRERRTRRVHPGINDSLIRSDCRPHAGVAKLADAGRGRAVTVAALQASGFRL